MMDSSDLRDPEDDFSISESGSETEVSHFYDSSDSESDDSSSDGSTLLPGRV